MAARLVTFASEATATLAVHDDAVIVSLADLTQPGEFVQVLARVVETFGSMTEVRVLGYAQHGYPAGMVLPVHNDRIAA